MVKFSKKPKKFTKKKNRRGKKRRILKTPGAAAELKEAQEVAASHGVFVIRRGQTADTVKSLVGDMRRVMSPHTAKKLRERSTNTLKDFQNIAGVLGVTHMMLFSQSEATSRLQLRFIRFPRGPTLTFRILGYSLSVDVRAVLKHARPPGKEDLFAPLLVLNGFADIQGPQGALLTSTLQNMFQSLNVHTLKLSHCRRVVVFQYEAESDTILMRHYLITVVRTPSVSSGSAAKLAQLLDPSKKKIQSLRHLTDISELFAGSGASSSSSSSSSSGVDFDFEENDMIADDPASLGEQQKIRLLELGPRIQMRLIKVEDGFASGETLYHAIVHKTNAETQALRLKRRKKLELKEKRRKEQEENVRRKEAEKEAQREESRRQHKLLQNANKVAEKLDGSVGAPSTSNLSDASPRGRSKSKGLYGTKKPKGKSSERSTDRDKSERNPKKKQRSSSAKSSSTKSSKSTKGARDRSSSRGRSSSKGRDRSSSRGRSSSKSSKPSKSGKSPKGGKFASKRRRT